MIDGKCLVDLYKTCKDFQHQHELTLNELYTLSLSVAVLCLLIENDRDVQTNEDALEEIAASVLVNMGLYEDEFEDT